MNLRQAMMMQTSHKAMNAANHLFDVERRMKEKAQDPEPANNVPKSRRQL